MSYRIDPGGIFASDTHRRVLAHLPLPKDDPMPLDGPPVAKAHKHYLGHRVSADPHHGLATVDELEDVLKDLEADGYAGKTKVGWKQTKRGQEALAAPLPEEPTGPVGPALIEGLQTGGSGGLNG